MSKFAGGAPRPRFSVIVPVLDEAPIIASFLAHLQKRAPGAEVIVVDGGSRDRTVALAETFVDRVLSAPRGRASQMNAGASLARGDFLWFLHADSRLPRNPRPLDAMAAALGNPATVGGCFRLRFPRPQPIYRISDSLGNLAVDLFRIALGDHGIFCRRAAFERVGGYPHVPLMEDAELYCTLRHQCGRMRQLRPYIVSSPRRYEQFGPVRTTSYYLLILALYITGVRIDFLHRIYQRLISARDSERTRCSELATATPLIAVPRPLSG